MSPSHDSRPRPAPLLLVGTANRHKVEEITAILRDLPVRVSGAGGLPSFPRVGETGATFEENARLKAAAFARAASELPAADRPRWVLSDDSGLCVDALEGRPGVHSARYAADPETGNASAAANNEKLLRELAGVPPGSRGAHFVCVLALVEVPHGGREPSLRFTVRGECHGRIVEAARGEGGFGYDPLFLVPELGRTFAELPPGDKNRLSHRGRALESLAEKMRRLLERAGTGAL